VVSSAQKLVRRALQSSLLTTEAEEERRCSALSPFRKLREEGT